MVTPDSEADEPRHYIKTLRDFKHYKLEEYWEKYFELIEHQLQQLNKHYIIYYIIGYEYYHVSLYAKHFDFGKVLTVITFFQCRN